MEPTFFPDGYTRDGFIAAAPGIHGAVAFTYRPAVFEERQAQLSKSDRDTPKQATVKIVGFLARKVLSWDIAHPATGEPVPVSEKTLPNVPTAILLRMECIVLGVLPSDDKPAGPSGAEESEADAKN